MINLVIQDPRKLEVKHKVVVKAPAGVSSTAYVYNNAWALKKEHSDAVLDNVTVENGATIVVTYVKENSIC